MKQEVKVKRGKEQREGERWWPCGNKVRFNLMSKVGTSNLRKEELFSKHQG